MKPIHLECVLCVNFFTEADVENFNFFPSTRICYSCYRELQKSSNAISCFGKEYDVMAEECRTLCPDRSLCPGFANKKFIRLRKQVEKETTLIPVKVNIRQYPFRPSSLLYKAFKLCMKGVDLTTLKRWCKHRGKNHHWVLRVLRKEKNSNGRRWKLHEKQNTVTVEYPLSR